MTTRDPSRFVLVSKVLARRSGLLLLLAMGSGLVAAGCGNSSSTGDSQPFPEFEGVWAVDEDDSSLSCPMEVDLKDGTPFPIVNSTLTIEAGVLSDLVETDTLCRFNYDVMGKIATMPMPDPYTMVAPTCTVGVSSTDGSNVVLTPSATPVWTFKLLAPVAGEAPTAQIVGAADAAVSLGTTDSSGNPTGMLQMLTPCTFAAQVKLHKIAKP